MLHPGTLLLIWAGFVFFLSALGARELLPILPFILAGALWAAARRTRQMFKRARWLLLSIAILFVFATPGIRAEGVWGEWGITEDGLTLAAEHVARLTVLLATLACLHEFLGTPGMVSGLYWLARPLAFFGDLRERSAVRLMLVLRWIDEERDRRGWREWIEAEDDGEPATLAFETRSAHVVDWAVLIVLVGIGITVCAS